MANKNNDEFNEVQPPTRKTWCWINKERLCGGDCEAFDPKNAGDLKGVMCACRILNSMRGIGAALTTIARTPGSPLKPPGVA